jgi:heterotetrameric sarcosine oxidase gamma subunit
VDNSAAAPSVVEGDGLRVTGLPGQVASLRYFDRMGRFAETVRETLGMPLPQALRATARDSAGRGAGLVLAWRSPTETLLLCGDHDRPAFAELQQRLADAADGSMVDQTGGIRGYRLEGQRARDLLQRMGATTTIPGLGEARGGRLAELQVLAACVQAGEFLLWVERVYADHLVEWMRATVADFTR